MSRCVGLVGVMGLGVLILGATPSFAGEIERGRALHRDNCVHCHAAMVGGDGTGIYVRQDRRIGSYEALQAQVRRCKTSLGVPWPEDQIQDVVTYLNTQFYKFDTQGEQ